MVSYDGVKVYTNWEEADRVSVPGGYVIVLYSRSPLDMNESVQAILEIEG